MPPGMPMGMPPGMPMGMPPGMPMGMPPGIPPGMPMGMPPGMPPGMPMGMPEIPAAELAKIETIFGNIRSSCFLKCVHQFNESEINPAEAICVDRCVVKFLKTHEKVAHRLGQSTNF